MRALREPFGDIGRTEMYVLLLIIFIIITIIIIIIIIIIYDIIISIINIYYLEFYIVSHKAKRKKEKDCITYDVEIVCVTMEI